MDEAENYKIAAIGENGILKQTLYSYGTLESSTIIRVLKLLPGCGEQPLRGELVHLDLDAEHLPQYEALSYVWGKPEFERRLETIDGDILLTPNLGEALKRIRRPTQTRFIWADAVCINQCNTNERGHQVKLMKRIYSKASRVVVWLGADPKRCARVTFKHVKEMVKGRIGFDSTSDAELNFSIDLFGCDWFERLWVVQEVVLAQAAIALWGNEEVNFADLSYAAWKYSDYMPRSRSAWLVRFFPSSSIFLLPGVRSDLNFLDVLRWTRNLKCSDPRDKIYAMLGLPYCRDDRIGRESRLNRVIDEIEPDYTRTVAEVYHELASIIIRRGGLSEILNAVHHGPTLEEDVGTIPSWVPLWIDASATDFYLDTRSMQLPRPVPPSLDFRRKSVTIQGIYSNLIISTSRSDLVNLDCLSHFWTENVEPHASPHYDMLFCEALMSDQIRLYTGVANQRASLYSRLAASYLLVQHSTMYPDSAIKESSPEEKMLRSISRSLAVCSGRPWEREIEDAVPENEDVPRRDRLWRGRRLFFASGNYIGLGPDAMRQGDIVVIPTGATAPCVLRPRDTFYQFVGTANIPGILNGDVVEGIRDECVHSFEIR